MSQLDRQKSRQRALEAHKAVCNLVAKAPMPDSYRARIEARLEELWTEADAAMGGEETRP